MWWKKQQTRNAIGGGLRVVVLQASEMAYYGDPRGQGSELVLMGGLDGHYFRRTGHGSDGSEVHCCLIVDLWTFAESKDP